MAAGKTEIQKRFVILLDNNNSFGVEVRKNYF